MRLLLVATMALAGLGALAEARLSESGVAAPLVFGIYPMAGVGTVGTKGQTRGADPARELAALEQLRGGARPFVVRLYTAYDGSTSTLSNEVVRQIQSYTAAGFRIELVLRYRPAGSDISSNVSGYVSFVRGVVDLVGSNRLLRSLQVTNEVNMTASADASDGAYTGAVDALVQGVVGAKYEARHDGFSQLQVGFAWAYETGGAADAFWPELARTGGSSFISALDWVGIDVYPGTWGPPLAAGDLRSTVRARMITALQTLRGTHLRQAGIPSSVAIHISENGYPTGTGRSDATQALVLDAEVRAVHDVRGDLHITDYRWFDLRDADSSNSSFQSHYGLLRDDYTPKPAFSTYRSLVAQLGQRIRR